MRRVYEFAFFRQYVHFSKMGKICYAVEYVCFIVKKSPSKKAFRASIFQAAAAPAHGLASIIRAFDPFEIIAIHVPAYANVQFL